MTNIPNPPQNEPLPFYRGESMRRTFRRGDSLRVEPVLRDEVRPGDILLFFRDLSKGEGAGTSDGTGRRGSGEDFKGGREQIVHRLIAIRPDGSLVTQGDNNDAPDPPIPMGTEIRRVVGVVREGREFPVAGGRKGLRLFRIHQVRRRVRILVATFIDPFLRLAPLRFLAFAFGRPEIARFAGEECLYLGKRLLAVRSMDVHNWRIPDPFLRLFFSRHRLDALFPKKGTD